MRILYIVSKSVEINTSASIRNSAVIRGLMDLGHTVTLVSAMPDKKSEYYDESLLPKSVDVLYLENGNSQKLVDWLKRTPFLKPIKQIVSNHINTIELYDSQKWVINHIGEVNFDNYDCVISSSDPKSSHLFVYEGMMKKNRTAIKWIQIWGDPFLGDVSITNSQIRDEIYDEERRLISGADEVYYVSEATLEAQKQNYPEFARKMHHIPIPYLKERIFMLRDLKSVTPVELCYCGDYPSKYRNIKPLYDTINRMEGVHITICGASDIKLIETDKVTILPRQGYQRVEEIEAKADILVHLSNSFGTQIPGKIYQYSGTNKPILFILDGDKEISKNIFSKYHRYMFTDNDPDSIERGIKNLTIFNDSQNPVPEFDKKRIVSMIRLG